MIRASKVFSDDKSRVFPCRWHSQNATNCLRSAPVGAKQAPLAPSATIRTIFYKKIGYLFVFLVKLDKAADLYASVQIFALPFDAFIIWCWGKKVLHMMIPTDFFVLRTFEILQTFGIRSFFAKKQQKMATSSCLGGSIRVACPLASKLAESIYPFYPGIIILSHTG